MALTINTNVASLNAQRQLLNSGNDLDQASERLASGLRVNNAADDAAGLAIANRLTSQIRGLDQAIRNANDGISLIQTAEGALNETTNILQRIRELSIQSSNGIYSDTDRSTLDAEVQQLKSELDRIATSTTFNGQPILDGSLGAVTLQAGSEATDTIDLEIAAVDTKALGGQNTGDVIGTQVVGVSIDAAGALGTLRQITDSGTPATALSINQQDVGDLSLATTVGEALETINANISGVETTAFVEMVATNVGNGIVRGDNTVDITITLQDGSVNNLQIKNTGSLEEFVERVNGLAGDSLNASINDDGSLVMQSDVAAFILVGDSGTTPDAVAATGFDTLELTQAFQLSFEATSDDIKSVDLVVGADLSAAAASIGLNTRTAGDITGIVITGAADLDLDVGALQINGVDIGVIETTGTPGATINAQAIADAINLLSGEHNVVALVNADDSLTLNSISGDEIEFVQDDTVTLVMTGLITTNISESKGDTVSSIAIDTAAGARNALNVVDAALEEINAIRADLGAINNRLDFTISNLSNVVENTSASRSRILDADFAAESAALSRAQVLQQASQAILAQANARPQQVLQLLQN
jgi:flagellin